MCVRMGRGGWLARCRNEPPAANRHWTVVRKIRGVFTHDLPTTDRTADDKVVATPRVIGSVTVGRERPRKVGSLDDDYRVPQTHRLQFEFERVNRAVHECCVCVCVCVCVNFSVNSVAHCGRDVHASSKQNAIRHDTNWIFNSVRTVNPSLNIRHTYPHEYSSWHVSRIHQGYRQIHILMNILFGMFHARSPSRFESPSTPFECRSKPPRDTWNTSRSLWNMFWFA